MLKHRGQHGLLTMITLPAVVGFVGLTGMTPTAAQAAGGHQVMEQCVDRVLSRLTRTGAVEGEVSRAVLSECDGPLRLVLADAIDSGEAPLFCKVAICLDLARSRTAQEATEEYRRRTRTAPHIAVTPSSMTNSALVTKAASSQAR